MRQENTALSINENWSSTSALLKLLESHGEKLINRKSPLITDALAGKIEIREEAA
jgi:hypothetical protein